MRFPFRITKTSVLRISIGCIFLYFGLLKFAASYSPAEAIAEATISQLTMGLISDKMAIYLLAVLETALGLFIVSNIYPRLIFKIAIAHLVFTFAPLIFFPELTFNEHFLSPTLLGQYIAKNLIIIAALISIYPSQPSRLKISS